MKHPNIYWHKRANCYYFGKMVKGQRRLIALSTNDLREALRKADLLRDHPLAVAGPSTGSFMESVEAFLKYKEDAGRRRMKRGYTPRSLSTKGYNIKKFARWLPVGKTAANVTAEDVSNWHEHLINTEGRAETTASGYLMTVRAFFRWAVEVAKIRIENPVKKVDLPKSSHVSRSEFLREHESAPLIKAASNDDLRFILFCGFDAGMRRDEIVNARRDWFDLEARVIYVRSAERAPRMRDSERPWTPKYRKERKVPLTAEFKKFLEKYLNRNLASYDYALKPEVKWGKADYRYDFRLPFTKFMASQKLRWVTPHIMRHSWTSNLASLGIPALELASWLGDSVKMVEKHYAHFYPSTRKIDMLHARSAPAPDMADQLGRLRGGSVLTPEMAKWLANQFGGLTPSNSTSGPLQDGK